MSQVSTSGEFDWDAVRETFQNVDSHKAAGKVIQINPRTNRIGWTNDRSKAATYEEITAFIDKILSKTQSTDSKLDIHHFKSMQKVLDQMRPREVAKITKQMVILQKKSENAGTLRKWWYSRDIRALNAAKQKLEGIIDALKNRITTMTKHQQIQSGSPLPSEENPPALPREGTSLLGDTMSVSSFSFRISQNPPPSSTGIFSRIKNFITVKFGTPSRPMPRSSVSAPTSPTMAQPPEPSADTSSIAPSVRSQATVAPVLPDTASLASVRSSSSRVPTYTKRGENEAEARRLLENSPVGSRVLYRQPTLGSNVDYLIVKLPPRSRGGEPVYQTLLMKSTDVDQEASIEIKMSNHFTFLVSETDLIVDDEDRARDDLELSSVGEYRLWKETDEEGNETIKLMLKTGEDEYEETPLTNTQNLFAEIEKAINPERPAA